MEREKHSHEQKESSALPKQVNQHSISGARARGTVDYNELLTSLDNMRRFHNQTSSPVSILSPLPTAASKTSLRMDLGPKYSPAKHRVLTEVSANSVPCNNASEGGGNDMQLSSAAIPSAGDTANSANQRDSGILPFQQPSVSGAGLIAQRVILNTTSHPWNTSEKASRGNASGARLCYRTQYGGRMNFNMHQASTLIGRKDGNDIVLADPKISKEHCCILFDASMPGYFIKDLNSANGVKVNDQLIPPEVLYPIYDEDVLLIGSLSLTFYNDKFASSRHASTPTTSPDSRVTIIPSGAHYDDSITIQNEVEAGEMNFAKASNISNLETLREDYEKLRLVYELSRRPPGDLQDTCKSTLDLIFDILPFNRGVIMLQDKATGVLGEIAVKHRKNGKEDRTSEILISSTIINKVVSNKRCLVTLDAIDDPSLGKSESVRKGQIRSAVCMPLIAHKNFYGILHLDSTEKIRKLLSKDISLIQSIANQTAIMVENKNLLLEVESKAKITEQLSRFLPPNVVDRMNKAEMIKRGGRTITGTVVFADIRGFTNLSEKATPIEVVNLLNDFFERLVRIVFKWDGIVDKFIGDALMAVFGTLEDEKDAEFRATAAALEFKKAVHEMNLERTRSRKEPIAIGVGVNTGVLLSGFIGSSQRLEYTCIGDSVNTSSRICSLAAVDQVLIAESTYVCVRDRVDAVFLGHKQFKGKETQVAVYEVRGIAGVSENTSSHKLQNGQTLRVK